MMGLMDEAQEYWNRVDTDESIRVHAHWYGTKRNSPLRWKRIGDHHWSKFVRAVEVSGQQLEEFASMVEWGVGGGANAVRFCEHFKFFYGVDISEKTLEECKKQLDRRELANRFCAYLIDCKYPEFDSGPVDFFLSTATFQHFPSREYGAQVLALAYHMLRDRGLAVVQIRWNDRSPYYRPKTAQYGKGKNAIRFTSYGIGEFYTIAHAAGFVSLDRIDFERANYAYFYLMKEAK